MAAGAGGVAAVGGRSFPWSAVAQPSSARPPAGAVPVTVFARETLSSCVFPADQLEQTAEGTGDIGTEAPRGG